MSKQSGDTTRLKPVAPFRRVVTGHETSDTDGLSVQIHDSSLDLKPVLNGNAYLTPLYSALDVPTYNTHSITLDEVNHRASQVQGVVYPGGVNAQTTDLAPNFYVPMHRTNSVDYNVIIEGEVTLITPKDGSEEEGSLEETHVKAGEVVIQRGTLHAWKAGPNGARWVTVIVAALPVKVGDQDGKELAEVDFK